MPSLDNFVSVDPEGFAEGHGSPSRKEMLMTMIHKVMSVNRSDLEEEINIRAAAEIMETVLHYCRCVVDVAVIGIDHYLSCTCESYL